MSDDLPQVLGFLVSGLRRKVQDLCSRAAFQRDGVKPGGGGGGPGRRGCGRRAGPVDRSPAPARHQVPSERLCST